MLNFFQRYFLLEAGHLMHEFCCDLFRKVPNLRHCSKYKLILCIVNQCSAPLQGRLEEFLHVKLHNAKLSARALPTGREPVCE